ncbi:hypothetical protein SAMN04489740_2250 [Arthrobacter alpinus]|uniref:Uncharacterized protein n=2 Tax=Arthrobacter alpinus TaxID=656366 RepID=A0A1H5L0G9_9MICC|nr:hypothetical protein SAMN04489740_2250 [Arthrobacter alpinus]
MRKDISGALNAASSWVRKDLPAPPRRGYCVNMSKNSDYDDKDLINEPSSADPLAEVYSEMVSPDIEEINEHAAALEEEAEIEPDSL